MLFLSCDGNIQSPKSNGGYYHDKRKKNHKRRNQGACQKYSLAAADIEKGIEGLEAEDIFLSADYIEDMIINGDLLPLTITLNLEKATYSDTDADVPCRMRQT